MIAYAGLFFAVPILLAFGVLSFAALFAVLVVGFGALGEVPAGALSLALLAGIAAGAGRLATAMERRRPGPLIQQVGAMSPFRAADVGSKAARLGRMRAAGENVPPALVVTARFFDRFASHVDLVPDPVQRPPADVWSTPLPADLSSDLRRALGEIGEEMLVVRSSFGGEDEPGRSAAGMHRTVIGLSATDHSAVEDAIRQVWASWWSPGALAYRERAAESSTGSPPRLAVLLQRWIPHSRRGHAASIDPGDGRDDRVLVESTDGDLGSPRSWRFDPGASGPRGAPNDPSPAALAGVLRRAQNRSDGRAVEVEWGIVGDELCLYQERPLGLAPLRVYSNGVFGEGITAPLTPLSESVLLDGIGWLGLLRARLTRMGVPLPAGVPEAVRYAGCWYLGEAPFRALRSAPLTESDLAVALPRQGRVLLDVLRTALGGGRAIGRVEARVGDDGDGALDPRPLLSGLRRLVELDHAAAFAAQTLSGLARALGGVQAGFPSRLVGERRVLLLDLLAKDPTEGQVAHSFGDLSLGALELRDPRFAERPDLALALPAAPPVASSRVGPRLAPVPAAVWRLGLRVARLRERSRRAIDRVNAVLRGRALRWGSAALPEGHPSDAVFFVRLSEWTAALDGVDPPDLTTLAARRARWESDLQLEAPARVGRRAADGVVAPLARQDPLAHRPSVGAAPGVAEGPLRRLRRSGPPNPESGHALPESGWVAFVPDADTGWLARLRGASALVLGSGGALSHLAMVARELGLPCVVVPDLDVPDGTRVRVDGDRGTVERVTQREDLLPDAGT